MEKGTINGIIDDIPVAQLSENEVSMLKETEKKINQNGRDEIYLIAFERQGEQGSFHRKEQ